MRSTRHFRIIVVAALIASLALIAAPTAEAQTPTRDTGRETSFLAQLNAQRATRGLPALTLSSSMSQAAADWTSQMIHGSFLAHASNIAAGAPHGWSKVGENVGRGRTTSTLTSAFMRSATHRANVLDPSFTHVGIAVIVHPDGRVYTTHRFAAIPSTRTLPPATAAVQPRATAPAAAPAKAAEPERNSQAEQRAAAHEARIRLMNELFGQG